MKQNLVEQMQIREQVCEMLVQKQSKEAKQAAEAQDFSGFVTVTELAERMTNERHVLDENAKRMSDLERTLYAPAAPGIARKPLCPNPIPIGTDSPNRGRMGTESTKVW